MYVADAVAMPVHWMYNLRNLKRDYGEITGYVAPKEHFEGSIMNLSNTGGAGRGSDKGSIVGDVILHGKKKYWAGGKSYHYHVGMKAGENTLETHLARLLTRQMTTDGEFVAENYLKSYVEFMQTPGSHPDTYAATAHRMFFKNLVAGSPPGKCADNDAHNVDSIDALTIAVPVIVKYREANRDERNAKVVEAIRTLRNVTSVEKYAIVYSDMLVAVLNGAELRDVVGDAAKKIGMGDIRSVVEGSRSDPMVA